jgi:hypothetical protein
MVTSAPPTLKMKKRNKMMVKKKPLVERIQWTIWHMSAIVQWVLNTQVQQTEQLQRYNLYISDFLRHQQSTCVSHHWWRQLQQYGKFRVGQEAWLDHMATLAPISYSVAKCFGKGQGNTNFQSFFLDWFLSQFYWLWCSSYASLFYFIG